MKTLAVVILALLLGSPLQAEPAIPQGKNLGTIRITDKETLPARELQALAKLHPSASVLVVVATARLNEHVTEHYKWLYDRRAKKLAYMNRTAMRFSEDSTVWFLWSDIESSDFTARIPFMSKSHPPTLSKPKLARQSFPLFYPENPAITDWP